jgi:hypothetical protein
MIAQAGTGGASPPLNGSAVHGSVLNAGFMVLGTLLVAESAKNDRLFSDDVACDIRNYYRELLEDEVEDSAADAADSREVQVVSGGRRIVCALIALAVTQSKLGRLEPDVRDRALALLDAGADLAAWEEDNPKLLPKRRTVLEKARAQLIGPQPKRKRVRPPKRELCGLAAGDVLALALPQRVALLRVVRVLAHRLGETPVLEELDFDGTEVPERDALERLGSRVNDRITFLNPSDTRGPRVRHAAKSTGTGPVSRKCRRSPLVPATTRSAAKLRHLVV